MPTFNASDNIDGDITSKVKVHSNIDIKKVGNYNITYSVTDSSNNENTNNDNTTTSSPSETQEDTTSNKKEDTKKEDEIKNPDTGAFAPIGLLLGTIVLSTVILFVIKKHNIFMKI